MIPRAWLYVGTMISFLAWGGTGATAQQSDSFAPEEIAEYDYAAEFADAFPTGPHGWTFRTGALFLQGPHLSETLLVSRGSFTPALFSNAIEIGAGTGWELEAEKQLNDDWTLGGRYFKVDSFSDHTSASGVARGSGITFRNGLVGLLFAPGGAGAYDLTYGADLESVDLSLKKQACDFLRISAGLRYLRFEDNIAFIATGNGLTSTVNLNASNEMGGAFLGGEALLLSRNRLEIWALGNAGAYLNDTDVSFRVQTSSNPNFPTTTRASTSHGAFVGELELKARYNLFERVSIEGGYRLLWLDNIAFSNEQPSRNLLPSFPIDVISNKDSLLLHGATLNLVVQF